MIPNLDLSVKVLVTIDQCIDQFELHRNKLNTNLCLLGHLLNLNKILQQAFNVMQHKQCFKLNVISFNVINLSVL